jgi:hypothetical protein
VDKGSKYINKRSVQLLNKLLIELTKSHGRHPNDNALVECKNGSVVRKHLGYAHILQRRAPHINTFNPVIVKEGVALFLSQLPPTNAVRI